MDKRIAEINKTKQRIETISKKLQWVFFVVFACYALIIIAISIYGIVLTSEFEFVGINSLFSAISALCNSIAYGVALLILAFMFRTVGKGNSPFNLSFVKVLIALGIIFLVAVVSGLFISPDALIGIDDESMVMAMDYGSNYNDIVNIDLKSLLASIVCFALAAIFRYGAVLQTEVDDLL